MSAGLVLVALTMTLALNSRRRDFGRRRALGASRSALVALTLLEASLPVLVGVGLGIITGLIALRLSLGVLPGAAFVAAAGALIAVAGTAAAIPPALVASMRDPMLILRVP